MTEPNPKKRVRSPEYYERKRIRDRERNRDRWLIPEDGIIDPVAIAVATAGTRLVRLTPAERELAVHRIIANGGAVAELAAHLGISLVNAVRLAHSLGYRTLRSEHANKSLVLPPDNRRLGPSREGHGHAATCMCRTRDDDSPWEGVA